MAEKMTIAGLFISIDESLKEIFAGGAGLARNSEKLQKFLPIITAFAEKAPVFAALAERLSALVAQGEPETLFETYNLVRALRITQAKAAPDKDSETEEHRYPDTPLKNLRLTAELKALLKDVKKPESTRRGRNSTQENALKTLYKNGLYDHPIFLDAYCQTLSEGGGSDYLKDTILPALGDKLLPHFERYYTLVVGTGVGEDGAETGETMFFTLGEPVHGAAHFLEYLFKQKGEEAVQWASSVINGCGEEDFETLTKTIDLLGKYPDCVKAFNSAYQPSLLERIQGKFAEMADETTDLKACTEITGFFEEHPEYASKEAWESFRDKALNSIESDGWDIRQFAAKTLGKVALSEQWDSAKLEETLKPLFEDSVKDVQLAAYSAAINLAKAKGDTARFDSLCDKLAETDSRSGENFLAETYIELVKAENADAEKYLDKFIDLDRGNADEITAIAGYYAAHKDALTAERVDRLGDYFSAQCKSSTTYAEAPLDALIRLCAETYNPEKYVGALTAYPKDGRNVSEQNIKKAFAALVAFSPRLAAGAYKDALREFIEGPYMTRASALETLLAFIAKNEGDQTYFDTLRFYAKNSWSVARGYVLARYIELSADWDAEKCLALVGGFAEDNERSNRRTAFDALVTRAKASGDAAFFEDVLNRFEQDEDGDIRFAVLIAGLDLRRTSWDAAKYQEYLLTLAGDGSFRIRRLAFRELAKGDVSGWEDSLLAALQGEELENKTVDALTLIPSEKIASALIETAKTLLPDYNGDDSDKRYKLGAVLCALAARPEESGIRFLDETLTETFLNEFSFYNKYARDGILDYLSRDNTPLKNQVYAGAVGRRGEDADNDQKLLAGFRTLSKEEFFERFRDLGLKRSDYLALTLFSAPPLPDERKFWDARWAGFLLENCVGARIDYATKLVYDRDEPVWAKLFDAVFDEAGENAGSCAGYIDKLAEHAEGLLVRAFANKHPQAQAFRDRLLAEGYPAANIERLV